MKCPYCGGDVITNPEIGIGICTCCMAEIPVSEKEGTREKMDQGNLLLSENRFDEAKEVFRDILIENPLDAAVCWGMALCEYGIEYVKDPENGELIPTMHRLSLSSFSEFIYTKKAIEYAISLETKEFYQKQSEWIDQIQAESLVISQKEEPYDIFICYKKTEEGEKRTADSRMAGDYYRELTNLGYKVFFAEKTLIAGEEYEPKIFAALQSAKVMLAFSSKPEYYDGVWVRNEWNRYADLIQKEKETKKEESRILVPVFRNMSHDELPDLLKAMPHYVDITKNTNPKQEVFRILSDHFKKQKAEDVSYIRRQVGGRESDIVMAESAKNYMTRATVLLVNEEYSEAEIYFRNSLAMEESWEAYLGLMMCKSSIAGKEALAVFPYDIRKKEFFKKAYACADMAGRETLDKMADICAENVKWAQVCKAKQTELTAKVDEYLCKVENGILPGEGSQLYNKMETRLNKMKQVDAISEEGILPFIIKIGVGILAYNLIPGELYQNGRGFLFLAVSIGACVIYYFIKGKERLEAWKFSRDMEKGGTEFKNNQKQIKKLMKQDFQAAVLKEATKYRQYFITEDEWNETLSVWNKKAEEKIDFMIQMLTIGI